MKNFILKVVEDFNVLAEDFQVLADDFVALSKITEKIGLQKELAVGKGYGEGTEVKENPVCEKSDDTNEDRCKKIENICEGIDENTCKDAHKNICRDVYENSCGQINHNKEKNQVSTEIKIEDVRGFLSEKTRNGKVKEVKELIRKYGAEKLTALDPSCYKELLKEAENI